MSRISQRAALCDALDAVHPSAPTLCAGWTAHHLAAHSWLRENDLPAALGMFVPALAGRTEQRMAEVMTGRSYPELVAAIRGGPPALSPYRLPGVDAAANSIEFFIHCEDVRRGSGVNTPRPVDPEFENQAWRRLVPMARLWLRGSRIAVWLERDTPPAGPLRIGRGPDIVTVVGRPSELLLYLSGRHAAAQVEVIGWPAAVSVLEHR